MTSMKDKCDFSKCRFCEEVVTWITGRPFHTQDVRCVDCELNNWHLSCPVEFVEHKCDGYKKHLEVQKVLQARAILRDREARGYL